MRVREWLPPLILILMGLCVIFGLVAMHTPSNKSPRVDCILLDRDWFEDCAKHRHLEYCQSDFEELRGVKCRR